MKFPISAIFLSFALTSCTETEEVKVTVRNPDGTTVEKNISTKELENIRRFDDEYYHTITESIKPDGSLRIENKDIDDEVFLSLFRKDTNKPKRVVIDPSAEALVNRVMEIMDMAKIAGADTIQMNMKEER